MKRKRYRVGQRFRGIPVGTLNSLSADVDRLLQQTGQPVGAALTSRNDTPAWLIVPVRNMTGVDLVEYSIAGVDTSAYTLPTIISGSPEQNTADAAVLAGPALEIVLPNADTHKLRWVVVLGPLANGATGFAVVSGLVPARLDQLHTDHEFARPATGDSVYLQSAGHGAPVWFRRLAVTGKQWGLILLGTATARLPLQLAVCTSATTAPPAYSGVPSDFSFKIQGVGDFVGEAVLLNASEELAWGAAGLEVKIHRPTGTETIDQLKFGFLNIHKDRVINVGDVIRVWTNDGTPIVPGISLSHSSGPDVYAELWDGTGGTGGDRLVAADDSDSSPGELIEKLFSTAPLTINDNPVYAVVDAGPPRKVVLHTPRYTGAGGVVIGGQTISLDPDNFDSGAAKQVFGHAFGDFGWFPDEGGGTTYTAGCGISLAGDAIAVVGSTLAGAGLTASGCTLSVGAGCGITVNADTVSVNRGALIGPLATLMNASTECGIEVRDAWKVKSTTDDTTPNFLHDAINDAATFVSGQDPLIKTETVGAGGTDQKERLFLDASAVDAWTSTDNEVLGHTTDGAAHWFKVDLGLEVDTNELQLYDTNYAAGLKQLYGHATGTFQHFEIGCGLTHHVASASIRVDASALAGDGLAVDTSITACGLKVVTGLGVYVITDSVSLSTTGYSSGLTEVYGHVSGTFQHFEIGCGLTVVGGVLKVDTDALNPGGSCALSFEGGGPTYSAGCGITIASSTISVEITDLVGDASGLDTSGSCGLAVDAGLGLQIDTTADANGEVALYRTGYIDSAKQQYVHHSGTFQFVAAYTVKCTVDDSTASYLHDAIKDNATYVSGQDAIVATATDGAGGTDQKERLFVDVSAISGWSVGATQLLGHVADTLAWKTISEWLALLAGFNSDTDQSIGKNASSTTVLWQDDEVCAE